MPECIEDARAEAAVGFEDACDSGEDAQAWLSARVIAYAEMLAGLAMEDEKKMELSLSLTREGLHVSVTRVTM